LEAHAKGVVTSTTCLINLDWDRSWTAALKKQTRFGIGLHLNIVYGKPATPKKNIPTLVDDNGEFRHRLLDLRRIRTNDVEREFRGQIELFRKRLGRKPTHIDTHYHVHEQGRIFAIVRHLAQENNIPFRPRFLTDVSLTTEPRVNEEGVKYLFGVLNPDWQWTVPRFLNFLNHLPEGTSEMIVHPGKSDEGFEKISQMAQGRERELSVLTSKEITAALKKEKVELIHYGQLLA
jgi:predicted glycoside hydrolase/deacetylase ChbG (UPF0249 family)